MRPTLCAAGAKLFQAPAAPTAKLFAGRSNAWLGLSVIAATKQTGCALLGMQLRPRTCLGFQSLLFAPIEHSSDNN